MNYSFKYLSDKYRNYQREIICLNTIIQCDKNMDNFIIRQN